MQAHPSRKTFPLSDNAPTYTFEGTSYQFITTEDGSPSIRMWRSSIGAEMPAEAMHHCAGALSESVYIYGTLVDEVISRGWPARILSVGLGCAYNEWIALARLLHTDCSAESIYLESFEADPRLNGSFKLWLFEEFSDPFSHLYTEVVNKVSNHFGLDAQNLKTFGRNAFEKEQWRIRDRLEKGLAFHTKFTAIFFDAFSTKATPELWSEPFLDWFLAQAADTNCGLSTYAATGRLNRALKHAGFVLVPYRGFSGKRQSTRAFRETTPISHVTSQAQRNTLVP